MAFRTNIQNMFYEEVTTKQDFSYMSVCPLSILYNSKYILMAVLEECYRCKEGSL